VHAALSDGWPRGYGDAVVTATYRDLFAAISASAAALTGLLFVAMSVAPSRRLAAGPGPIRQIRAAAALLSFVNALAVSLYGLVPETNIGYPALVMSVIGILFTAAAIRSVVSSPITRRQQLGQTGLFVLLVLIFGAEIVSGVAVIADARNGARVQVIGYALVSSLIVGISRAWELVGDRDTGMLASLAVLAGRSPYTGGTSAAGASGTDANMAAEPGDAGQSASGPADMGQREPRAGQADDRGA
jgi:hypothetical protein